MIGRWGDGAIGLLVVAALAACASPGGGYRARAAALERAGRPSDAVAELRLAVAAEPRDARSLRALARLEVRVGLPGAALRHLEAVERLGAGTSPALADLLVRRAREAAAWGGRGRWRDLERAVAADPARAGAIQAELAEARIVAAQAHWQAGDRATAGALLAKVPGAQPLAEGVVLADDALADAEAHGEVDRVRAALVRALGEPAGEPDLERLRSVRPLTADAVADVAALALAAWAWGERDAWIDEPLAAWLGAERDARPLDAFPGWLRPALAALSGEPAPPGAAESSVPEGGLGAQAGDTPPRTVLAGAAASIAASVFGGPVTDPPEPLLAVVARGSAAARHRAAGTGAGADALRRRLELEPLFDPAAGTRAARRAHEALRRWRRALEPLGATRIAEILRARPALAAVLGEDVGRGAAPLGLVPRGDPPTTPGCPPPDQVALVALRAAMLKDVSVAEHLAEDYVDRDASPHCRGLAVGRSWLGAGDPARAVAWARTAIEVDPTDETAHGLLVEALAAARDPARLGVALTEAEYWSRERGAPSARAARALIANDLPVDAVAAGRQALALASGARRWDALEVLVEAATTAGRDRDARVAWAVLARELPARRHDEARRRIRSRLLAVGVVPAPWLAPVPGVLDGLDAAALARLSAEIPGFPLAAIRHADHVRADGRASEAAQLLEGALATGPRSVYAIAARAWAAPTGSDERRVWAADLLLAGLVLDGARAVAALSAFAELMQAEGQDALATVARTEAALAR